MKFRHRFHVCLGIENLDMRLYIIRHASPHYAKDTIDGNGHIEAAALSNYLSGLNIDEIYSSPLGRAVDTAQYTAVRLGLPINQEAWMQELVRLWIPEIDKTLWDLNGSFFRSAEFLSRMNAWQSISPLDHPQLAETMEMLRRQSDEFLARQGLVRIGGVYQVAKKNQKQIAVFCHLGFGLTWLSHLLEIPLPLVWAGFYLYPASVTTILFEERPAGIAVPRCLGLGDISHLVAQGIQPQPYGLLSNQQ